MENDGFYKDLIDNLYDGVYFVNRDRTITFWNKGAELITGYDREFVMGHSCRDNLLNHVTEKGVELCKGGCPLAKCMEDGKPREAEVFLHHANGSRVPVFVRTSPIRDESGTIIGAVEIFNNNSKRYTTQKEVMHLRKKINQDELTGIHNRTFMEGRLRAARAEFEHQDAPIGLLFIDIDHFKKVNDNYGHDIGDKVLRMVAGTLEDNLRASDIVSRWGGEEFMVLVYDVGSLDEIKHIADKLRTMVGFSRLDMESGSIRVTISIGGTQLLANDTIDTFMKRADAFMYESKKSGRNQIRLG